MACGGRRAVKVTKTGKWMERRRRKNNDKSGNNNKTKSKIVFHNGAWENRPLTPTKKDPRAALWTTGTSGKALFDKLMTTFTLI